ncbi:MAG: cytochrome c oxidase assembly factor Coa1 family protein [Pseudomonadota bacterium]
MNEDSNTSGQGHTATVPAEIDRWNWGAFLMTWIWGIGNNTFLALLVFVPFVNIVMPFILGVKGSAWAWRHKRWASVEEFRRIQRNWARWGLALWLAFILLCVGLFFLAMGWLKDSDAFRLSLAQLEASPEAVEMIGTPVKTGFPSGSFDEQGAGGSASFSYTVTGPQGKGTVYVEASRDMGQWQIDRMALEEDGTGRRIDLSPQDEEDDNDNGTPEENRSQPAAPTEGDGRSIRTPSARAFRTSATAL